MWGKKQGAETPRTLRLLRTPQSFSSTSSAASISSPTSPQRRFESAAYAYAHPGAMEKLPAEVFNGLLDQLEPRGREGPTTNPRGNPWAVPQPYRPDHIDSRQHFSALRLVCRRFNELTAPYLFRSIGLRFNQKSFKRLEYLAANTQLAKHVRKFVYLMPYLYEEGALQASNIPAPMSYCGIDAIPHRNPRF